MHEDVGVPCPPVCTDPTGIPDTGSRPVERQREPHLAVPSPGV